MRHLGVQMIQRSTVYGDHRQVPQPVTREHGHVLPVPVPEDHLLDGTVSPFMEGWYWPFLQVLNRWYTPFIILQQARLVRVVQLKQSYFVLMKGLYCGQIFQQVYPMSPDV